MPKRWKWLLAGNAILVLGLCFLTWNYRSQRITKETAERIQPGMKLAEVEAILGPPRNELESRLALIFYPASDPWTCHRGNAPKLEDKWWISKSMAILVIFNGDTECVDSVHSEAPAIFDPTWSEKLEARWNEWRGK